VPQRLRDELGTQEPALSGNALNWIGGEWVDKSRTDATFDFCNIIESIADSVWPLSEVRV
jgi:hypothetical protein